MRVISRALLLTAAAVFATGALAAGAPAAAKGPRTKDGKPDLNGIWQAHGPFQIIVSYGVAALGQRFGVGCKNAVLAPRRQDGEQQTVILEGV